MDDHPAVRTPLSTDAGRLARVTEVVDDVSTRLRGICAALADAEFHALVRRIAEVTVKYEALSEAHAIRAALPPPRPGASADAAGNGTAPPDPR